MENDRINPFWDAYLDSLPAGEEKPSARYPAWAFGDQPGLASRLGKLVQEGIKTATCGLLWEYENEQEPLPETGDRSIILDGHGQPLCVVETVQVDIVPFGEVSADFAFEEGEGDRSLAYWREAHIHFFTRILAEETVDFSDESLLVCERFRLVYNPDKPSEEAPA